MLLPLTMAEPLLILADFLPYRLSFTSNLVSSRIATAYAALFNLTIAQWRLIAVIAEKGAATQQALGSHTGMEKVTVSRAAAELVARGLLERRPNSDDRRSHMLLLTNDGHALYRTVAPRALAMESQIFACLSDAEQVQLAALLKRVDEAMQAEGGACSNPVAVVATSA
jgi:DNA-binding MarR family transcriptional regulator